MKVLHDLSLNVNLILDEKWVSLFLLVILWCQMFFFSVLLEYPLKAVIMYLIIFLKAKAKLFIFRLRHYYDFKGFVSELKLFSFWGSWTRKCLKLRAKEIMICFNANRSLKKMVNVVYLWRAIIAMVSACSLLRENDMKGNEILWIL